MKKETKKISGLNYLSRLMRRYRQGTATDKEREALDRWTPDIHLADASPEEEQRVDVCTEKVWQRLNEQIHRQPVFLRSWKRISAAAVILIFGSGAWFAYNATHNTDPQHSELASATAPRRAWTTDDSHRRTLTLPDGSVIRINAGSRLEIAEAAYNKEKREVWLSGEAFFEVAKNPAKPFIIHTGEMQTTVRGTSFNVKAYDGLGENVVSVRDGRVEVSSAAASGKMLGVLTANRQLRYNTTQRTAQTSDADWHDAAGWTEGRLVLDGVGAKELELRLKQHFGVSVSVTGNALDGKSISGSFRADKTLVEVMNAVSALYNIHYEIDNRQVIIMP